MITAIVPVKALSLAKRRLSDVLAPPTRERLVLTMLADVLATLTAAPSIDRVLVVTPDPRVARHAYEAGAMALVERDAAGLNTAIQEGLASATRAGAAAALVVPADVPLATVADIEALAAAASARTQPFVFLVPDTGRGGTNALLVSLPNAIEPRFGTDSLVRHAENAERRGIPHEIVALGGLALDIDEPGDLAALTRPGPAATRYAFLGSGLHPLHTCEAREGAESCMSGVSNA